MSRALPRRSRDRGARWRGGRSHRGASPAFTETDDQQATTGLVGDAPVRRTSVPVEAPGSDLAPSAHEVPARVHVETTEAADPDLPALTAATEISSNSTSDVAADPSEAATDPTARRTTSGRVTFGVRHRRPLVVAWLVAVLAGLTCLVLAMLEIGPALLDDVGATVVLVSYTWALAARTGGRPVVFAVAAAVASVAVVLGDQAYLRTGAAVMTCAVAAVLALVATVPARTYAGAVRESVVAVLIAAVGAMATVGFAPTISLVRFEYATLALALVGAFAVVYRLGAGFHGLGRRGVVAVVGGGAVLVGTLLYAEALRRYGAPGTVSTLLDAVRWSREALGAFPRPVVAVLGVPAVVWGVHLRARRRQGWWVCAFGAAGTAAVANSLVNPAITFREGGLSVVYGLLVGLAIGWLVIRVDLALGGTGAGGRRSEEHAAARPEPPRTASLI